MLFEGDTAPLDPVVPPGWWAVKYRVCVRTWVVVEATNEKSAKARAENAVRKQMSMAYKHGNGACDWLADDWDRYAFRAVGKAEKVEDD